MEDYEKLTPENVKKVALDIISEGRADNYKELLWSVEMEILNCVGCLSHDHKENVVLDALWSLHRDGYINFGNCDYVDGLSLEFFRPTQKLITEIEEKKEKERIKNVKKTKIDLIKHRFISVLLWAKERIYIHIHISSWLP